VGDDDVVGGDGGGHRPARYLDGRSHARKIACNAAGSWHTADMARQLWLLRHGEAEPHGAREDSERRLTPRGVDQSRAAGRALSVLVGEFDAVFASPKVRGWETAVYACESLGATPLEHPPLASGFDAREARELLEAVGADGRVLVVGHEPDFSQVVHDMTGARSDLKKGGVAGVRSDGTRDDLIVLLRPREIERIR
jgi:phosphohistidine phosphatase